jgi:spore coat-associated protein N
MSIKKKLGLGLASAALGLSLIGGGTYAYFNDTAVSSPNSFAAGTLDLAVNPEVMFTINNMKPGDRMLRQFTLTNSGTLAIDKVTLKTEILNSTDSDLKNHLVVKFIENEGQLPPGINFDQWDDHAGERIVTEKTLAELEGMTVEDLADELGLTEDGIRPNGGKDYLTVQIDFRDNGLDQNHLQGDSLGFKWTFTGEQGAGIWK